MRRLVSFTLLFLCYGVSKLFYRTKIKWIGESRPNWERVSLILLLGHSSLFEPLFISVFPIRFIWRMSRDLAMPGADKTLNRPIVGKFFKLIAPNTVSITRRRDQTWDQFVHIVKKGALVFLLPEGRMMRRNGLDSTGKPLNIRTGIADVLSHINEGELMIGYSGGLHHVQAPGEMKVAFFKTIWINLETLDLKNYKSNFEKDSFVTQIVADLEARKLRNTPHTSDKI